MKSLVLVLVLVLAPLAVANAQDVVDITTSKPSEETAKAFKWGAEHPDVPYRQEQPQPAADRRDFAVNDDVARQRASAAAANARRAVAANNSIRRDFSALKRADAQRDKKVYWNKKTKKFEFINLPALRDRVDEVDAKATAAGTDAANAKADAAKVSGRVDEVEKSLKDKTGKPYDLASIHDNANEGAYLASITKSKANLNLVLWAVLFLFVLILFVVVIRHIRKYGVDREVIQADFINRGVIVE